MSKKVRPVCVEHKVPLIEVGWEALRDGDVRQRLPNGTYRYLRCPTGEHAA